MTDKVRRVVGLVPIGIYAAAMLVVSGSVLITAGHWVLALALIFGNTFFVGTLVACWRRDHYVAALDRFRAERYRWQAEQDRRVATLVIMGEASAKPCLPEPDALWRVRASHHSGITVDSNPVPEGPDAVDQLTDPELRWQALRRLDDLLLQPKES